MNERLLPAHPPSSPLLSWKMASKVASDLRTGKAFAIPGSGKYA